jgi:hypothetical protein
MIDYMKRHERHVREMLEKNLSPEELAELLAWHDQRIQWMQHERLVHLITMLFVCLFTLLAGGFASVMPTIACFVLSALLLILAVAYVIHYYRLENSIQKWYALSDQIKLSGGRN